MLYLYRLVLRIGLALVPYNQTRDFVGRAKILEDLKQHLGFGDPQGILGSRVALYGLGGVG